MKKQNHRLRVGIIQTKLSSSFSSNFARTKKLIQKLILKKPDLILLPEMFLGTPPSPEERASWSKNYVTAIQDMRQTAKTFKTGFYFSYLSKKGTRYFNTALFMDKTGKVLHKYHKIHLFSYGNEHIMFDSGKKISNFSFFGQRMAGIICYDIRFPELSRILAHKGSKILFVCAQWPNSRTLHWNTLLKARAIENQCFVVACNRLGTKDKLVFDGHSLVISPWGDSLLELSSSQEIGWVDLDLSLVDRVRQSYPFFKERRGKLIWQLKN